MYEIAVPPGWPQQVRPPGAPGWERTAIAWLYDLCPPEYRAHALLRRHPRLLARLALHQVEAAVQSARRGYSTARVELRDEFEPQVIEELLAVYAQEGPRLVALSRSVRLVSEALSGVRWRPRI